MYIKQNKRINLFEIHYSLSLGAQGWVCVAVCIASLQLSSEN